MPSLVTELTESRRRKGKRTSSATAKSPARATSEKAVSIHPPSHNMQDPATDAAVAVSLDYIIPGEYNIPEYYTGRNLCTFVHRLSIAVVGISMLSAFYTVYVTFRNESLLSSINPLTPVVNLVNSIPSRVVTGGVTQFRSTGPEGINSERSGLIGVCNHTKTNSTNVTADSSLSYDNSKNAKSMSVSMTRILGNLKRGFAAPLSQQINAIQLRKEYEQVKVHVDKSVDVENLVDVDKVDVDKVDVEISVDVDSSYSSTTHNSTTHNNTTASHNSTTTKLDRSNIRETNMLDISISSWETEEKDVRSVQQIFNSWRNIQSASVMRKQLQYVEEYLLDLEDLESRLVESRSDSQAVWVLSLLEDSNIENDLLSKDKELGENHASIVFYQNPITEGSYPEYIREFSVYLTEKPPVHNKQPLWKKNFRFYIKVSNNGPNKQSIGEAYAETNTKNDVYLGRIF